MELSPDSIDGGKVVKDILDDLEELDGNEKEFLQAVKEVLNSLKPLLDENPQFGAALKRAVYPERMVIFRVPWVDKEGKMQVNRGFRVQFNSALGPYKGGLRFTKGVNLSVLKFLGFEQTFKNSLTGLNLGGGKGGSDFDGKGKTDAEVMAFCQSFMSELYRHIGAETDVPAGDIGVGAREVGFLFGQYKKLCNVFSGAMTGKGTEFGGSHIRSQATGYGVVYYLREMLKTKGEDLTDKRVLLSGAGNVSMFAIEKLLELGAKVVTISDSDGFLEFPDGITEQEYKDIRELKQKKRGRLSEAKKGKFTKGSVWENPPKADIAIPAATQNEIDADAAQKIKEAGVKLVCEGSNMPCNLDAIEFFVDKDILFGPGKAANSGGVLVSGWEMSQNATGLQWEEKEVAEKLEAEMRTIFKKCHKDAEKYKVPLYQGANIAGARRVLKSMVAQGVV